MIKELSTDIKRSNSTDIISYDLLGNIAILQGLLKSNPSLITADLADLIDKFIDDQMSLVSEGKATVNPELLKLLDLGLFVAK